MSEYSDPNEVRGSLPDKFWKPTQKGEGIQGSFLGYVKTAFFKEFRHENERGETVLEKRPVYQVELDVEGRAKQLPSQCTPLCLSQNAEPGDQIIATYEGEGEAKKGMNAPKIYKVQVVK